MKRSKEQKDRDVINRKRLRSEQKEADLKAINTERREQMRDYFHWLMSWPPPEGMA